MAFNSFKLNRIRRKMEIMEHFSQNNYYLSTLVFNQEKKKT